MTELSDELLVAYVDGQLARKQIRAVEKVLDQDDVIAARVDALKHAHARLEAAFEAILAGEEMDVSAASAPRAGRHRHRVARRPRWLSPSIGIAVGTSSGGCRLRLAAVLPKHHGAATGGDVSPQGASVAPAWQEEMARAHALLSRESSGGRSGESGQSRFRHASSSRKSSASNLKLPNLEPQGFRFVRAQALRIGRRARGPDSLSRRARRPAGALCQEGRGERHAHGGAVRLGRDGGVGGRRRRLSARRRHGRHAC